MIDDNDLLKIIYESIKENPQITKEILAAKVKKVDRTVQKYLKKLRDEGYITYDGINQKDSNWIIKKKLSRIIILQLSPRLSPQMVNRKNI